MSITVPSSTSDISTGDYVLGEVIEAPDFEALTDRLHYLYAHMGGRGHSHVWEPFYQRSSTTLGTAPDNNVRPLDRARPPIQPHRPARGSDNWPITVYAFVTDAQVEAGIYDIQGGTLIRSATTTVTGDQWVAVSYTLTDSEVGTTIGHPPLEVRLRIAASASDTTAELRQLSVREAILTSGDMPIAS